jgi:putative endonuclease
MATYFVYILQSSLNDSFYKGSTDDLSRRFFEHNSGKATSTSRYCPWYLVWYTTKENRSEALLLERKLKNLSVKKTLDFIKKYPTENPCVGAPDVTLPRQSGC